MKPHYLFNNINFKKNSFHKDVLNVKILRGNFFSKKCSKIELPEN